MSFFPADPPYIFQPVTENFGSDHYAARVVDIMRKGRTIAVMPEWAICAAYLSPTASPADIAAEVAKVRAHEARTGGDAWHPYVQAALSRGSFRPSTYTLRKDGRYRPTGADNYGALTMGVATTKLDEGF